jgi:hypothetical protein
VLAHQADLLYGLVGTGHSRHLMRQQAHHTSLAPWLNPEGTFVIAAGQIRVRPFTQGKGGYYGTIARSASFNGLAFSRRERAAQDSFKKARSHARSGRLQRRVGPLAALVGHAEV